jgi:hypothetical protein
MTARKYSAATALPLVRSNAYLPRRWPSAMPTAAQCHAHGGPVPCPRWPSAMPTARPLVRSNAYLPRSPSRSVPRKQAKPIRPRLRRAAAGGHDVGPALEAHALQQRHEAENDVVVACEAAGAAPSGDGPFLGGEMAETENRAPAGGENELHGRKRAKHGVSTHAAMGCPKVTAWHWAGMALGQAWH